jgi:hypothetical protein
MNNLRKTKKKALSEKSQVMLREKILANGNRSLYLDIYRDGKSEYEFLKLYLIKATTPIEREQNRQTLAVANAVKAKRLIEIQNGEYGFISQFKIDTTFLEYYRKMCEDRHGNPESRGNWGTWYSCLRHLERYCSERTTFKDITPEVSRIIWIILPVKIKKKARIVSRLKCFHNGIILIVISFQFYECKYNIF